MSPSELPNSPIQSIQQSPLRLKISIDALCKDFRLISHLERENEQQKNS
jgi:hypothetical protein